MATPTPVVARAVATPTPVAARVALPRAGGPTASLLLALTSGGLAALSAGLFLRRRP